LGNRSVCSNRSLEEIASALVITPRRSWLEDSTDVVVDELDRFDLVASRAHEVN